MQIRIRSDRAGYRRAGLVFPQARAWVYFVLAGEAQAGEPEINEAQSLAACADPVLHVQFRTEDDDAWADVSAEARKAAHHRVFGRRPAPEAADDLSDEPLGGGPEGDDFEEIEETGADACEVQNELRAEVGTTAPAQTPKKPAARASRGGRRGQ